jgi:alkylated DNA nucleotide flippase Atl1
MTTRSPSNTLPDRVTAITTLARIVGDALLAFAKQYEDAADVVPEPTDHIDVIPEGRGLRQKQILELPGLVAESGMKTADIATGIDYEVPNTHATLQTLQRNGLVELVPGVIPQTWRLAPRYRNTAPVFKRLASRVKAGEWTTYGDISIAVRGDTKAARGVGRAAAAIPDFPHPERVLMDGGYINPNWKDSEGRGPDHCRELLEQQGVPFDGDRAAPSQRVTWDELRRRDEQPVE